MNILAASTAKIIGTLARLPDVQDDDAEIAQKLFRCALRSPLTFHKDGGALRLLALAMSPSLPQDAGLVMDLKQAAGIVLSNFVSDQLAEVPAARSAPALMILLTGYVSGGMGVMTQRALEVVDTIDPEAPTTISVSGRITGAPLSLPTPVGEIIIDIIDDQDDDVTSYVLAFAPNSPEGLADRAEFRTWKKARWWIRSKLLQPDMTGAVAHAGRPHSTQDAALGAEALALVDDCL